MQVRIAESNGEILVRGPSVATRYLDTGAATDADAWLHTGDLGRFTASGELQVISRLKDTVIVNGFNVLPAEVEEVLRRHPAVADVMVLGAPDAHR